MGGGVIALAAVPSCARACAGAGPVTTSGGEARTDHAGLCAGERSRHRGRGWFLEGLCKGNGFSCDSLTRKMNSDPGFCLLWLGLRRLEMRNDLDQLPIHVLEAHGDCQVGFAGFGVFGDADFDFRRAVEAEGFDVVDAKSGFAGLA